jgi:hypothetical protein
MTATTLDIQKEHKKEYAAKAQPALVTVSQATYLSISGVGAPGGEAFVAAIGALYGVAFTVKMTRKFAKKRDYVVSKLECLWGEFDPNDREQWPWQLMIRTPDFVTPDEVKQAIAVLLKRGKGAEVERVALESMDEGLCVQALHVGPYEDECNTISAMRSFADAKGLVFRGRHHEIYISDPRRISPERLKTILRQPVRPV